MHSKHLEHNTDCFAWIYAHGTCGLPQSAYYPLVYLEHNGRGTGKKGSKLKTTDPAFSCRVGTDFFLKGFN